MRLAVVGWAADSGVGRELVDAVRHLPVQAAFVLKNQYKPTRKELLGQVPFMEAKEWDQDLDMGRFLDAHRTDTVLTWEVPGSWSFPEIWRRRGIRWVHVVHWDWFPLQYVGLFSQAALVAPNAMCKAALAEQGLASTLLSVPVDTERIPFRQRERADSFLSVYGFGGQDGRRSLAEVFMAWRTIASPPPLLVRAQKPPEEAGPPPPGVELALGSVPEPTDLWALGDVAVQPSRFEGVGTTFLEAQASGMPVLTVDADPMRELAPDLLVAVDHVTTTIALGKTVRSHVPSVASLAERIRSLHRSDIKELSRRARARAEARSWNALKPAWMDVLSGGRGAA